MLYQRFSATIAQKYGRAARHARRTLAVLAHARQAATHTVPGNTPLQAGAGAGAGVGVGATNKDTKSGDDEALPLLSVPRRRWVPWQGDRVDVDWVTGKTERVLDAFVTEVTSSSSSSTAAAVAAATATAATTITSSSCSTAASSTSTASILEVSVCYLDTDSHEDGLSISSMSDHGRSRVRPKFGLASFQCIAALAQLVASVLVVRVCVRVCVRACVCVSVCVCLRV
jgi:hypothetical protein